MCCYCQLKKDVQLESCEFRFIWGKMSLGGSISENSERLLQSGSGRKSIYKVLVKEEFTTMKHSFYPRCFVSYEGLMSP